MNQAGIAALKTALSEAEKRVDTEFKYLEGIREKLARSSRDYEKAAQLAEALREAVSNAESEGESHG